MTYEEIMMLDGVKKLVDEKTWPLAEVNEDGEHVIVDHEENDGDPRFHVITLQNNGWYRHTYVYKNGMVEYNYESDEPKD